MLRIFDRERLSCALFTGLSKLDRDDVWVGGVTKGSLPSWVVVVPLDRVWRLLEYPLGTKCPKGVGKLEQLPELRLLGSPDKVSPATPVSSRCPPGSSKPLPG